MIATLYIDTVTRIASRLSSPFVTLLFEPASQHFRDSLNDTIKELLDWKGREQFTLRLSDEIREVVINVQEHKTRKVLASALIGQLIDDWIPTYDRIAKALENVLIIKANAGLITDVEFRMRLGDAIKEPQRVKVSQEQLLKEITKHQLTEEQIKVVEQNDEDVSQLQYAFSDFIRNAVSILNMSVPKLYKQHEDAFDRFLKATQPPQRLTGSISWDIIDYDPFLSSEQSISIAHHSEYTSTEPKLRWKEEHGAKTDLAELIWAIAKSRRIINSITGKPATIPELTQQFGAMLNTSLDVTRLVQARADSYLAKDDGVTFTASLARLVDDYIDSKADREKIAKKTPN